MGPQAWYEAYFAANEEVLVEVQESFVKQTYRNRCLIHDAQGHEVVLTVPVQKVEHKQLTRDIEISYQSRWQHQHWISLVSAYKHTPFFDYYAAFFKPWYEKETKWLWDLNNGLHETIMQLLQNSMKPVSGYAYQPTTDWRGEELNRYFGDGKSILDVLFEYGNETKDRLE